MARPLAIMLQGTGSDVGKSMLVAGLCRAYRRRGLRVRPFKPQNMSNNAAVAEGLDGKPGEIGRAQALQARACGVEPHVHMNPVLLKPQTDIGAQVVVQGRVLGNAKARDYYALKPTLMPKVLESFQALGDDCDLVLVEGAGSPAEVNLRAADIANMGFAEAANIPVVLVGDIDRGGVIASLVGTHALLPKAEQDRIKGYVINKFRGDPRLFDDGLTIITAKTNWPSLGVVPYFPGASGLPKEDAFALERADQHSPGDGDYLIAVPRLGRIANFDDIDPLLAEPGLSVQFIEPGSPIPAEARAVILPGSKATLSDLDMLRAEGWDEDIRAHYRRGGKVIGLCGGYQLLGNTVADPDGIEGPPREEAGLGLLDITTALAGSKELTATTARDLASGEAVQGYEMHMGVTSGPGRDRPWFQLPNGTNEGAISQDGLVMGTYLHGLFAADGFRRQFMQSLDPSLQSTHAFDAGVEAALDALAEHLEAHMDLDQVLSLAKGSGE